MHISTKRRAQLLHYVVFAFILLSYALDAGAQNFPERYQSLVSLPQLNNQGQGLADYFNQLYMVAVAIGAILAFIKISIAGVKWSMSEIITDKSDAKKDIQGALLGLAILLIPFIVLNTIYSGLTNLNILENAQRVMIRPPSSLDGPPANQPPPIVVTPETPTGPPPQYDQVQWPFSCVSQTDCAAARRTCNNVLGSVIREGMTASCGYSVVCQFRRNVGAEGPDNPTPCR